jgi:SET domain-containing protein
MDKIVENEGDQIDMPEGYFVQVKPSKIHGNGLFATKDFKAGELVCPGRINGKRTPAGRYMNHSTNANVAPEKVGDDINAVALRDIYVGEELLVDYRTSMRVNFGITIEGEMPCHFS